MLKRLSVLLVFSFIVLSLSGQSVQGSVIQLVKDDIEQYFFLPFEEHNNYDSAQTDIYGFLYKSNWRSIYLGNYGLDILNCCRYGKIDSLNIETIPRIKYENNAFLTSFTSVNNQIKVLLEEQSFIAVNKEESIYIKAIFISGDYCLCNYAFMPGVTEIEESYETYFFYNTMVLRNLLPGEKDIINNFFQFYYDANR